MAKQKPTTSIRVSPELRRQIDALKKTWGENQQKVIERAVQQAYQRHAKSKS